MEKIRVRWEVEDGYAGQSRPQETVIDVENDLMSEEEWNELSEDQKKENIDSLVQEDFEQRIHFGIEDYGINE